MSDTTIMTLLGFLVAIIAIVTPLMKLNSTIAKLTVVVNNLEENMKAGHSDLSGRVKEHGRQIDDLEKVTANHDARITNLEDKR